jgi:hypothetical protein
MESKPSHDVFEDVYRSPEFQERFNQVRIDPNWTLIKKQPNILGYYTYYYQNVSGDRATFLNVNLN